MVTSRAPISSARSLAAFSAARTEVSKEEKPASDSCRGATLISMLNRPSSVWNCGSAIASSTSTLRIAGLPSVSTRLSSISSPAIGRSKSNRDSVSIRASTSSPRRTFSRCSLRSALVNCRASTSSPMATSWRTRDPAVCVSVPARTRAGMARVTGVLAAFDGYYRSLTPGPAPSDRAPADPATFRFEPSGHVQGAWRDDEQHMAPVSGLLAHCLLSHRPRPELQLCRISYDILGVIGAAETTVSVRTLRAGRTIELVAAELAVADRVAVRATGWRLLRGDTTGIATTIDDAARLPDPADSEPWDARGRWPGGYIDSVEVRRAPGVDGRVRAWIGTAVPLLADAEADPLAGYLGWSTPPTGSTRGWTRGGGRSPTPT